MREILFRGFNPDESGEQKVFVNGEWVKGYWVYGYYASKKETTYAVEEDYKRYPVKTEHFIIVEQMTDWGLPNKFLFYPVIRETVGQYTGLQDKNGKKIFEGDIVHCWYEDYSEIGLDSEFYAVVQFGNPNGDYTWGYQLRKVKGDKINYDILLWVEMEDAHAYCEAIGNIFENPELLKGG